MKFNPNNQYVFFANTEKAKKELEDYLTSINSTGHKILVGITGVVEFVDSQKTALSEDMELEKSVRERFKGQTEEKIQLRIEQLKAKKQEEKEEEKK